MARHSSAGRRSQNRRGRTDRPHLHLGSVPDNSRNLQIYRVQKVGTCRRRSDWICVWKYESVLYMLFCLFSAYEATKRDTTVLYEAQQQTCVVDSVGNSTNGIKEATKLTQFNGFHKGTLNTCSPSQQRASWFIVSPSTYITKAGMFFAYIYCLVSFSFWILETTESLLKCGFITWCNFFLSFKKLLSVLTKNKRHNRNKQNKTLNSSLVV